MRSACEADADALGPEGGAAPGDEATGAVWPVRHALGPVGGALPPAPPAEPLGAVLASAE